MSRIITTYDIINVDCNSALPKEKKKKKKQFPD